MWIQRYLTIYGVITRKIRRNFSYYLVKGDTFWSESPIKYSFKSGEIIVTTRDGNLLSGKAGKNLKDVYDYCVEHFFSPNGKIPDESLFTKPQFNTWIELQYNQNEDDILAYAKSIIDNGYEPGVIMLDDTWQENYGVWDFAPRQFKNPKAMIDKLHEMGFKVMVWICPFLSPDSKEFRFLAKEGMLLLDLQETQDIMWSNTKDKAAIIRWWNGASACLDLSNPKAREWFKGKLDYLQEEYGVDGFKFDAGDADFYMKGVVSKNAKTPNDHTTYFAQMGLDYPLNEYRASWKMAGLPLAHRLRDKWHNWSDLQKLIPDITSQSLMGYAYTCPDMIGGGQVAAFQNSSTLDQELIVRSAQVHALMPMMQFSAAPWRVLSPENAKLCKEAAQLHVEMGDLILGLANISSKTGTPIVKPMALAFPDDGFENIKNQFMLGDTILVAPILHKSTYKRQVVLPKGRWKADDDKVYKGGNTIIIDAPIERIPFFRKIG
ncbi:glycoside hydrolase family 31 protein [Joostella sp.]|uniref:glycoside hydrolase family 31 protein n=1 Tax=Joostella sp. TaxID=2231138 RepID=UPI003A8E919D